MDASTRLYARLGEIPEDPNDPESLNDLIVCAFGAFERYYLCWKTKSGEFRQDGYDLPPALNDWLNPTDGTTRDWASLQVVFGRGEEYFASDKNGKLEFKEQEAKKPAEEEEKDKIDRQALRRSRTVSFLRPLSQTSIRSDGVVADPSAPNRRTSSISSQRASRPPSLSYSTTGSEASVAFNPIPQASTMESPPVDILGANTGTKPVPTADTTESASKAIPGTTTDPTAERDTAAQVHSKSLSRTGISSIPEEKTASKPDAEPEACTCGCHDPPLPHIRRPTYANASVQTDPMSPSPRTALRVNTYSASSWASSDYSALSRDLQTPVLEKPFSAAPFSMGRMTNYFSKPGYQLGDSLASGYQYYEPPVYQYQDEFGSEVLR